MKMAGLGGLLALGVGLFFPVSGWTADVLDDSLSPRQAYNFQLKWAHHGDSARSGKTDLHRLIAVVPNVEVRLNTSGYVGENVSVFLALPIQIGGLSSSDGFTLSWDTRGTLYPGTTTPGNRFLIFKGNLDTPQLIEFFTFTLEVDANRLTGELRYAPIFEIERF